MKKTFLVLLLLSAIAYAVDVPIVVPDGDPFTNLMSLIMQWKTIGPLAGGALGVAVVVQLLKQFVGDAFVYKRAAVTVLGVIYGVLLAMSKGMGAVEAIVTALLVSGGAVAIYEALKPTLQKLQIKV